MTATPMLLVPLRDPKTGQESGGICSSTVVSDSGLILTAAHCMNDCVKDAKNRVDDSFVDSEKKAHCQIFINGIQTDVTVKLIGRCSPDDLVQLVTEKKASLKTKRTLKYANCAVDDELAIIDPQNKDINSKCLPISFVSPEVGEALGTQGYPSKTTRQSTDQEIQGGPKDTPGEILTWSNGTRVISDTCDIEYRFHNQLVTEKAPLGVARQLRTRLIQTSIDIVPGSSGGPLLNEQGEVVGVASAFAAFSRTIDLQKPASANEFECRGSSFFTPLSRLKTMIAKQNPQLASQLKCETHRATKNADVNL